MTLSQIYAGVNAMPFTLLGALMREREKERRKGDDAVYCWDYRDQLVILAARFGPPPRSAIDDVIVGMTQLFTR